MKYSLTLFLALAATWMLWSGHFQNAFLITLGGLSCVFSIWLSSRMHIVDDEGAPVQLGVKPFTSYAPWLAKEIVEANLEVSKIVLDPKLPMHRSMIDVKSQQKTELGRVILANSITLTPGTVSVDMQDEKIRVHAISFEGAEEDLSGEMGRRVCDLESSK